jgi:hypothetical protein
MAKRKIAAKLKFRLAFVTVVSRGRVVFRSPKTADCCAFIDGWYGRIPGTTYAEFKGLPKPTTKPE